MLDVEITAVCAVETILVELTMNPERKNKTGLTLVEILVVVAIIAILATMIIGLSHRIDTQAKEKLTASTIAMLTAALEQFYDYDYNYQGQYSDFDFPLDCNGFTKADIEHADMLSAALGGKTVEIVGIDKDYVEHSNVDHKIEDSGCAVLCFFLNRVAEIRKALEKIDASMLTNEGTSDGGTVRVYIMIKIDDKHYPFLRVVDAWDTTLRYDYYNEQLPPLDAFEFDIMRDTKRTFPLITSAGPDRRFGTSDDISNK